MVTGSRDTTTVATQALYNLNDPFVRKQSLAFAAELLSRKELDDSQHVGLAYSLAVGRKPTSAEVERVKQYLHDYVAAEQSQGKAVAKARTFRAAGSACGKRY